MPSMQSIEAVQAWCLAVLVELSSNYAMRKVMFEHDWVGKSINVSSSFNPGARE